MTDNIAAVGNFFNRIVFVSQGKLEVAYTDDYGINFVTFLLDEDDFVYSMDCFCIVGKSMFLATRKKSRVYRSGDGGKTWQVVEDGIAIAEGYRLISESFGHIFAVSENGLILSQDNGDTWSYMANPFENDMRAIEFAGS